MISPQPIQLWRYLGFRKNKISKGLKRLFYLSWEDALWDLLDKKDVKKGSTILVPEFFCGDVENNIKNHGYKVKRYKMLKNLKVNLRDFKVKLLEDPSVVIIFHPVGIRSNIDIKKVDKDIIFVEDCVHQIINLEDLKIERNNHFIIDSLRKVTPLQGSNLIGRNEDLNFSEPAMYQSFLYSIRVHILWILMILCWNFGLPELAEKLMIKGYDLIGDSKLSAPGFWIFKNLFEFIDYEKIYKLNEEQTKIYKKYIKTDISFGKSDWKNLRGYPVKINEKIIERLRNKKILLRYELFDSNWGRKNKIVYLPLGPHLSYDKIHQICKIFRLESSTLDLGV